jgi:starch-binding outer membrane protein, SusD/RagB family
MKKYKYLKIFSFVVAASFLFAGCTKLNEGLTSSLTTNQAGEFSSLFLQNAYTDLQSPENMSNFGNICEITTDEAIIPIRGGDWADGGEHVAYHLHNWTRNDGTTANNEGTFTGFNKLSYDATTVLGSTTATPDVLAQARFLRAFAVYNILDLWGQVPVRNPGDNLLLPAHVLTGDSAVLFLISELNTCITNLDPSRTNAGTATVNAARALLMRVYLNRGAFDNRAAPTFAASDMAQVISLGQSIMSSGSYSLSSDYFSIFSPTNSSSPELIFAIPYSESDNTSASSYGQPYGHWQMGLHYNSYTPLAPNAGWNGFATMGEFYNTFGVNGVTLTQTAADASQDQRLGGVPRTGVTDKSGLRVGFLVGQQYDANGNPETTRPISGVTYPLVFTNADEIPASSTTIAAPAGASIEASGFRVLKYSPDFTNGTITYTDPGNWQALIRYADVLLMIAEADMRTGDNTDALAIVNQIRAARSAAPLTSMLLQDPSNFYNPNTLLAERGREFYFENLRRTDLIRFGVFKSAYRLHPADAGNYFVFPMSAADLAANPNLQANIQGTNY